MIQVRNYLGRQLYSGDQEIREILKDAEARKPREKTDKHLRARTSKRTYKCTFPKCEFETGNVAVQA